MKRRIKVDYISRVEGEGGIKIDIRDGAIERLDLKIFEAPRFFEPLLKGRTAQDAIDFTARICGICPVAYQMSAVHAIEKLSGTVIEEPVRQLRRLLYCGEWIESHALHVYYLHGPDFYGLESAWAGKDYLPYLKRGIKLKKLGNEILTVLGGRPIHPVSVKPGGFFSLPEKEGLQRLVPSLEEGFMEAIEGIKWAASLFTDMAEPHEYPGIMVSLRDPAEYPMNSGRVISSDGLDLSMDEFFNTIEEYQVEHSTALHSCIKSDNKKLQYMVGPLSRLNLNHDLLPDEIRSVVKDRGISFPLKDLGMSIIARSIEIAYAFYEAARIIKNYDKPLRPFIDADPVKGEAVWITEAPRGMLIHSYEFDGNGRIAGARIIPPTSQNLAHIEGALFKYVSSNMDRPVGHLTKGCEKIVRSYDPCISCSVHILSDYRS